MDVVFVVCLGSPSILDVALFVFFVDSFVVSIFIVVIIAVIFVVVMIAVIVGGDHVLECGARHDADSPYLAVIGMHAQSNEPRPVYTFLNLLAPIAHARAAAYRRLVSSPKIDPPRIARKEEVAGTRIRIGCGGVAGVELLPRWGVVPNQ